MIPYSAALDRWKVRVQVHLESPLFRNAYLLMLNTLSTAALGLGYWIIAARLYTTEAVGNSSLAVTTMVFVTTIGGLNIYSGFIRFFPRAGKEVYRILFFSYFLTAGLVGASVLVLMALNAAGIMNFPFFNNGPAFNLWYVIACMLWVIFALQDSAITGMRQPKWVPLENTLFGVIKIVLLIILATSDPSTGIFVSWSAPTIVAIILINLLIVKRIIPQHLANRRPDLPPLKWRELFRFSIVDFVGSVFTISLTSALPYIVTQVGGESMNGFYNIAWTIASAFQFIANGMSMSFTVEGALDDSQLYSTARRAYRQLMRMLLPMVVVGVIAAPIALHLYGDEYVANSTTVFQLMALGVVPYSVNTLFLGISRVQRKLKQIILMQAALCIVTLGLALPLVHIYGLNGIGVAYLIGQSVIAGVLLLTLMRPVLLAPSSPETAVPDHA